MYFLLWLSSIRPLPFTPHFIQKIHKFSFRSFKKIWNISAIQPLWMNCPYALIFKMQISFLQIDVKLFVSGTQVTIYLSKCNDQCKWCSWNWNAMIYSDTTISTFLENKRNKTSMCLFYYMSITFIKWLPFHHNDISSSSTCLDDFDWLLHLETMIHKNKIEFCFLIFYKNFNLLLRCYH